jgi:hypothetical protein
MVSIDDDEKPACQGFVVPAPEYDGTWTQAPAFPSLAKKDIFDEADSQQASRDSAPLASLSYEELLARCHRAEAACARYEHASRTLLSALALSPSANAFYARHARTLLAAALVALPAVGTVGHVECSMPSIASGSEGPHLQLARFDGLQYSEWDVHWQPSSWWLSVSVVTALSLKVHVHVTDIRITGRVRCALPYDLSSVRVGFTDEPNVHLQINTSIELGSVPVPLHAAIDREIRQQVHNFLVSVDFLFAIPSSRGESTPICAA